MKIIENEEAIECLRNALGRTLPMLYQCCDQENLYSGEWQEMQDVIEQVKAALKATDGCSE